VAGSAVEGSPTRGDTCDGALPISQDVRISRLVTDNGKSYIYKPRSVSHGVYVVVLEGEVRIGDVLLRRRDSTILWDLESIECQVSADASDVLFVETAMIDQDQIEKMGSRASADDDRGSHSRLLSGASTLIAVSDRRYRFRSVGQQDLNLRPLDPQSDVGRIWVFCNVFRAQLTSRNRLDQSPAIPPYLRPVVTPL
jgi:hypothetical protein